MDNILKETEYVINITKKRHLYPNIPVITGSSASPCITIKGKQYLTFTSNNYLGLALHPSIKKAIKESVDTYGMGSASVRLLAGNLDIQVEFEKRLASWLKIEDVMTFSSGYLANIGVIRALTNPFSYYPFFKAPSAGFLFSDQLNHTSIIDACSLSKAERIIYNHADMNDLEEKLKNVPLKAKKLIVSDGVFSMDGDLTPVPDLVKLKKKYNAALMIDDSHGAGTVGERGGGVVEHFNAQKDVDVIMMSFTKAFGGLGGLIGGNKTLLDYLRVTARSYIFSDPIPPAIVAGLIESLNLLEKVTSLRKKLREHTKYLINGVKEIGLSVKEGITPIIPVIIGNEEKIIQLSQFLWERGIFSPPIRYPAVPRGEERLRVTLMATHEKRDIDILLKTLKEAKTKLKL